MKKEGTVLTATTTPSSTGSGMPQPGSLPQALTRPQTRRSDVTQREAQALSPPLTAGYDLVLLVAALEEIEARRAALEWLVDANLLCACLA
jgi:hypothetical protein